MRQENACAPRRERLPVCARVLTLLAVAAIVTDALFLQACATKRQTSSQNQTSADSVETVTGVRVAVSHETVPMEQAAVGMPLDSIPTMPEGTSYTARKGRATVEVKRIGNRMEAYATCDSLERQVEYYAELAYWYQRMYESSRDEQQSHPPDNSRNDTWKRTLIAMAFLAIGCFIGKVFK